MKTTNKFLEINNLVHQLDVTPTTGQKTHLEKLIDTLQQAILSYPKSPTRAYEHISTFNVIVNTSDIDPNSRVLLEKIYAITTQIENKQTSITIQPTTDLSILKPLKTAYLALATAPLDGMWLYGLVPQASHFTFYAEGVPIGFCCINDEGFLLQFYLDDDHVNASALLLSDMLDENYTELPSIVGAYVSTAEPSFLSICVDVFSSTVPKALMYQLNKIPDNPTPPKQPWELQVINMQDLDTVVTFYTRNLGRPREWLTSYVTDLIGKQQLYGCWLNGRLVGTGESRDLKWNGEDCTDLGIIVDQDQRKQGIATWVLQQLVERAVKKNSKPMCSTDYDNFGAQKAIQNAGLISRNRIVQFLR